MNDKLFEILNILSAIDDAPEGEWAEFKGDYPNVFRLIKLLLSCACKHDEEIERSSKIIQKNDYRLNALKDFVLKALDDDDPLSSSFSVNKNNKVEIN